MNLSRPLDSIPQHLVLKCIKKMEPRAFARSYRTCSSIKNHIETNEKQINITLPFELTIDTSIEKNEIVMKVFKNQVVIWMTTLSCEETAASGIPRLACFSFSSISFHFDCIHYAKSYVDQLLAAFGKYRITARHGSIAHNNPHIEQIVKALRLKELEIRGPIFNPFGEHWLYSDEVSSIEKLSVERTDGPLSEYLLRLVAPRCKSVDLKFMGKTEDYFGLLAGCLKDIQVNGEMRNGKVSIVHMGEDVPNDVLLNKFNGSYYKLTEDLGHPLLLFPFKEGRLLLAWRKCYTPLQKLRGMNFAYATVRDVDEAREFFENVYSKTQKETVESAVKLYRKRYLLN